MVEKSFFICYIVCALLNAYLLEKDLEPEVHNASVRGRRKRDVAEQLIESHTLCLRSGRPKLNTTDSTTTP